MVVREERQLRDRRARDRDERGKRRVGSEIGERERNREGEIDGERRLVDKEGSGGGGGRGVTLERGVVENWRETECVEMCVESVCRMGVCV